jgi:hypothetical protein
VFEDNHDDAYQCGRHTTKECRLSSAGGSCETLLIVRDGQPVVEMKPVKTGAETLRPFGLCAGEFTVPEDFDAPLPEDILQAFEGT